MYWKTESKVDKCSMTDALERWKSCMIEKDFITKSNNDASEVISSTKGNSTLKVKICAKKITNSTVTIIIGLEKFVNIKETIKTFSKHFACSVTIKEHENSKEAIFIQGYWVTELLDILQNEFKLKKEFITVEDKINKNKKKK